MTTQTKIIKLNVGRFRGDRKQLAKLVASGWAITEIIPLTFLELSYKARNTYILTREV